MTIRTCGLVRSDRPCYSTGRKASSSEVCQCDEDYCNSVPAIASTSVSLALLLPSLLAFNYWH